MLANTIDARQMGDRLPYVTSVNGPSMLVPKRVAISYAVRILAIY